jgi:hypothetical protein
MTEYRREICRSNRTVNIYKKRLCHLRDYLFFLGGFFVVIASQFRFIYDLGTSPSLLLSLTGISLIYCSIIVKKEMIIQKRFFFLYIIFLIPLFSLTIIWLGYSGFNYKDFLKYLLIFLLYNNFYLLLGNLDDCDSRYIIKIYLIILFINSLLIYAQMLFSFVNIHLFLPGQRYGYSNGFVRPCGLFAEPSHFGMFAFGLVVIDVKTIKSKINFYVYAVIALLPTFSAVSYFVVLLLAIKYVLKAKNFKNIILFVFVILVVFASIVSFPQSKRVLSLLSILD